MDRTHILGYLLIFGGCTVLYIILATPRILLNIFMPVTSAAATLKKNKGYIENYFFGKRSGYIFLPAGLSSFPLFNIADSWFNSIIETKDANYSYFSFLYAYALSENYPQILVPKIICHAVDIGIPLPEVSIIFRNDYRAPHDVRSTFPIYLNSYRFTLGIPELDNKYLFFGEDITPFLNDKLKELLFENAQNDILIKDGIILLTDRYTLGIFEFTEDTLNGYHEGRDFLKNLTEVLKQRE